jgi:hypothetical protein
MEGRQRLYMVFRRLRPAGIAAEVGAAGMVAVAGTTAEEECDED